MLKYLIIVNIISFVIYGIDKFLAIKHMYRISEFILLSFGFIGGVIGSIFGMIIFRHKINSVKFKIYLIIYSLLWIVLLLNYYNLLN